MDTFHSMKESVFHAENEEPRTRRNSGIRLLLWREPGAVWRAWRDSLSPNSRVSGPNEMQQKHGLGSN